MSTSDDSRNNITPTRAFPSSIDIVILAVIAIQVIVAVYGLVVLPDTVPIHWGLNGQADGYGSKWIGTILYPLLSVGIYALVRVLLVVGPRVGQQGDTLANLKLAKTILAGSILFMLIIQLVTIAASLGIGLDVSIVITLALSVLFIFLGNYMGKVRRNFWMGVRTPWSLANAVVWERTNRVGGWLFVAVGLIGIPSSFVPALRLWGILVPIIATTIFLYIYSYVCYRQQTQGDHDPLSPPFDGVNG